MMFRHPSIDVDAFARRKNSAWLNFLHWVLRYRANSTHDLGVTLTLSPRSSKSNQLIYRLNYIINQSLVEFRALICKISC